MTTSFAPLAIRQRLGRETWAAPIPYGPDGWRYDYKLERGQIFLTCSTLEGIAKEVIHASISFAGRMPSYEDMTHLHAAVWPNGYAYELFVPPRFHVNIAEHARHLWGHKDGSPMIPELSIDISDARLNLPGVGKVARSI
jgi:hypothetical protein